MAGKTAVETVAEETPVEKTKRAYTRRTPEQIAQSALEKAQRTLTVAQERLAKVVEQRAALNERVEVLEKEVKQAERNVAYRQASPYLYVEPAETPIIEPDVEPETSDLDIDPEVLEDEQL